MAHNVNTMMYVAEDVGQVPWHGLGKRLHKPPTAREAIVEAGMAWTVVEEPVFLKDGTELPAKAIRRDDNKEVLGVTGTLYRPIQNVQAFEFFDSVVGRGQAIYDTAGALGKGEKIWILARMEGDLRIENTDDITRKYLLLCNSHDGTLALRMFFTPIRVVCQNTLTAALSRGSSDGISIRHTPGLEHKVQEAQRVLGMAVKYYDDLNGISNSLARIQIKGPQVKKYLEELFPDNAQAERTTRTENIREEVLKRFTDGEAQRLRGIRGTWWAGYNAVAEYVDHGRSTRGKTDQEKRNNRLSSIWFGSGAALKRNAWELALKESGVAAQ